MGSLGALIIEASPGTRRDKQLEPHLCGSPSGPFAPLQLFVRSWKSVLELKPT